MRNFKQVDNQESTVKMWWYSHVSKVQVKIRQSMQLVLNSKPGQGRCANVQRGPRVLTRITWARAIIGEQDHAPREHRLRRLLVVHAQVTRDGRLELELLVALRTLVPRLVGDGDDRLGFAGRRRLHGTYPLLVPSPLQTDNSMSRSEL